nr:LemA family protein [Oscillochloris sp. ZM17-4]
MAVGRHSTGARPLKPKRLRLGAVTGRAAALPGRVLAGYRGTPVGTTLILLIVVIVVVLVGLIGIYNGLIGKRNRADQAFSSVDVMLKKRYDLIPNLVATVEKYMVHERELLSELTELRTRAVTGDMTPAQRAESERQIDSALGRVMVSVESYPDLKASQNFMHLQASLNEVEEQISASRRAYNAAVTDYNNAIQMLPGSLMAGPMGLSQRVLFEASAVERQSVDVRSMFQR